MSYDLYSKSSLWQMGVLMHTSQLCDVGRKSQRIKIMRATCPSVLPRQQPVSERAQRFGTFAEGRQRIDRLTVQKPHALLRRRNADHSRMRGFGTFAVRSGRFAQRGDIAGHVEQVVLDLEGQTHGRCKSSERG